MAYVFLIEPVMIVVFVVACFGLVLELALTKRSPDRSERRGFHVNPIRIAMHLLRSSHSGEVLDSAPGTSQLETALFVVKILYLIAFTALVLTLALITSEVHWYRVPGDPTT